MQILIKNNSSCRDQENNGPEFILRCRYCLVWRMCLEQGCRSLFYPIFNIWNVFNPVLVFLQHWMIFQCLWILISRHQSMTRNKRLQCCNKDQIGPSQLLTKIWQWYIKYACFISIIKPKIWPDSIEYMQFILYLHPIQLDTSHHCPRELFALNQESLEVF